MGSYTNTDNLTWKKNRLDTKYYFQRLMFSQALGGNFIRFIIFLWNLILSTSSLGRSRLDCGLMTRKVISYNPLRALSDLRACQLMSTLYRPQTVAIGNIYPSNHIFLVQF